jgi:2-oxoisovalerate dehydrogenase E2 component (dihydrolipoyl transacylase)
MNVCVGAALAANELAKINLRKNMSTTKIFYLPDLGEGLPDAEIVEWTVKVGDVIRLDEPLISMETAKAVVDVPSPVSGKILRLAGGPGDVIATGAWLAEFELDMSLPQRAEAQDTGHHHGGAHAPPAAAMAANIEPAKQADSAIAAEAAPTANTESKSTDAGTVVGAMQTSDAIRSEQAIAIGGVKAMPAVRALAKKLGIDLARVNATGADGVVTISDVKNAAANGSAKISMNTAALTLPSPYARGAGGEGGNTSDLFSTTSPITPSPALRAPSPGGRGESAAMDVDTPIRGVRRNMVRVMSEAHAQVVPTTLMDDADIHVWPAGEDITVRLIRALVVAAQAVPALNSWFNGKEGTLRRHSKVDIGIAVDTDDGLFVPALRHCENMTAQDARKAINRIRELVKTRSIPAEELRDFTIVLSNFGVFAGKYATPVVTPPCVCIVGAGRLFHELVPVLGGVETHRIMPISLTFDHRACTGGEAARFLRALLDDLQKPR